MRTRTRLLLAAAGVALLGACSGAQDDDGGGADASGTTVAVVGTDALAFEPTELTASAGTVTIELTAGETVEHTVVIEELGDDEVVAASPGETTTGSIELEPGAYTFYCSVPGHRPAGMEGELTVS